MGKLIWKTKTFWANVLSVAGMVISYYNGFIIPPEMIGLYFAIINIILRAITNEEIVWSSDDVE